VRLSQKGHANAVNGKQRKLKKEMCILFPMNIENTKHPTSQMRSNEYV